MNTNEVRIFAMMARSGNILFFLLVFYAGFSNNVAAQSGKPSGKLQFKIEHVFGGEPLVLNDKFYSTGSGDSFAVSMYKYYISNISFETLAGISMAEDSYYLVNEGKKASKKFTLDVPAGIYTTIRFLIGVDSLHNVNGAQDGALDPVNGMYWDWRTGYVMAKLEATTKGAEPKELSYHVGGYAGDNSTLQWVTLKFPKPVVVSRGTIPVISLRADAAEWFKTPVSIDMAKLQVVNMEGADAVQLARNYADMFSITNVE